MRGKKALLIISDLKGLTKKSWKKYLEIFGSLPKSPYLCTRFREGTEEKSNKVMRDSVILKGLLNGTRGRLAQLVQSVCLTSRGSAVRIRQRPRIDDTKVKSIRVKAHIFEIMTHLAR